MCISLAREPVYVSSFRSGVSPLSGVITYGMAKPCARRSGPSFARPTSGSRGRSAPTAATRAAGQAPTRSRFGRRERDLGSIVALDGQGIDGAKELRAALAQHAACDTVTPTMANGSGRREVEVTLAPGL